MVTLYYVTLFSLLLYPTCYSLTDGYGYYTYPSYEELGEELLDGEGEDYDIGSAGGPAEGGGGVVAGPAADVRDASAADGGGGQGVRGAPAAAGGGEQEVRGGPAAGDGESSSSSSDLVDSGTSKGVFSPSSPNGKIEAVDRVFSVPITLDWWVLRVPGKSTFFVVWST